MSIVTQKVLLVHPSKGRVLNEETNVEEVAEQAVGTITIEVSDNTVKYDTNMALPEMMFWIDVVKAMGIDKVMDKE